MKLNIWAKTFFSIYRCLDKLTKAIDSYVKSRAYASFATPLANITFNSTQNITQNLVDLINKKITLINIKLLVEEILLGIPKKYSKYIIQRYFENNSFLKITKRFNVSIRTIARWDKKVLEYAAEYLKLNKYTSAKLASLIGKEKWIYDLVKTGIENSSHKGYKPSFAIIMKKAHKEYSRIMF